MSLIRPEIRARLWRWRDALAGLGVAILGGYWALTSFGLLAWLGVVMMVAGIALAVAGWQRGRFRRAGGGAGVVQVNEGQVAYFGPVTGGILAVDAIGQVVLDPRPRSGPVWEFRAPGQEPLAIPVDAAGSEALFDVFAALPGLDTEAMLAALEDPGATPRTVWTRPHARLH